MFVIKRIIINQQQEKVYLPQTYGAPHQTREAADKHLAYVRKSVVGYSSPHVPYQFEVVEI
jgi:hypothetical protein